MNINHILIGVGTILIIISVILMTNYSMEPKPSLPWDEFCMKLVTSKFGFEQPICYKLTDKDCVCVEVNETKSFSIQEGGRFEPYWEDNNDR